MGCERTTPQRSGLGYFRPGRRDGTQIVGASASPVAEVQDAHSRNPAERSIGDEGGHVVRELAVLIHRRNHQSLAFEQRGGCRRPKGLTAASSRQMLGRSVSSLAALRCLTTNAQYTDSALRLRDIVTRIEACGQIRVTARKLARHRHGPRCGLRGVLYPWGYKTTGTCVRSSSEVWTAALSGVIFAALKAVFDVH